jgi:hypothetical protein
MSHALIELPHLPHDFWLYMYLRNGQQYFSVMLRVLFHYCGGYTGRAQDSKRARERASKQQHIHHCQQS